MPPSRLRALTLRHPWAFAVARLGKTVENRPQPMRRLGLTPGTVIAIHGGRVPTGQAFQEAQDDLRRVLRVTGVDGTQPGSVKRAWQATLSDSERAWLLTFGGRPTRAIDYFTPGLVALAQLGDDLGRVDGHPGVWAVPQQYQWPLTRLLALDAPIPLTGKQGAWYVPDDLAAALLAQWHAAESTGQLVTRKV